MLLEPRSTGGDCMFNPPLDGRGITSHNLGDPQATPALLVKTDRSLAISLRIFLMRTHSVYVVYLRGTKS